MDLIEQPGACEVEKLMSRARAILVSLIPALLVAAALDSFSETLSARVCVGRGCFMAAKGRAERDKLPAGSSTDEAWYRWSRRVNVQAGGVEFTSPLTLAADQLHRPQQIGVPVYFPFVSAELAQSWQFHWRTALQPRAPSLVS